LPFKANADRRHHIPKQRHRARNSAAYDAALRQRGSLTVWFTDAAIAAWKAEPRTTRGGQRHYSGLAITTALTLRAVFLLALRQTEGLIGSIIALLGLDLAVPDHSTLSRLTETLEVPRSRSRRDGEPMDLLVDSRGLNLPPSRSYSYLPRVLGSGHHNGGGRGVFRNEAHYHECSFASPPNPRSQVRPSLTVAGLRSTSRAAAAPATMVPSASAGPRCTSRRPIPPQITA